MLETVRTWLNLADGFDAEAGWHRFSWVRSAYYRPLRALAALTHAKPAPWTTDRPAKVGRPRFLRRRTLPVDWSIGPLAPVEPPSTPI